MDLGAIRSRRTNVLQKMNEQLQVLQQFHFTNTSKPADAGITVRKLIERLIEVKQNIVALEP